MTEGSSSFNWLILKILFQLPSECIKHQSVQLRGWKVPAYARNTVTCLHIHAFWKHSWFHLFSKTEFTLYYTRSFQYVREKKNSGSRRKVPNGSLLLLSSAAALFFRALPAPAASAQSRISNYLIFSLAILIKHTVPILQPTFCLCSLALKLHWQQADWKGCKWMWTLPPLFCCLKSSQNHPISYILNKIINLSPWRAGCSPQSWPVVANHFRNIGQVSKAHTETETEACLSFL